MVRAGVVNHPSEWPFSGYTEIQEPSQRYRLIAYDLLRDLLGFETYDDFRTAYKGWVEEALKHGKGIREAKWSESIAVGSEAFVERTKEELGIRAEGREVRELEGQFILREPQVSYNPGSGNIPRVF
jgi:putative transposase